MDRGELEPVWSQEFARPTGQPGAAPARGSDRLRGRPWCRCLCSPAGRHALCDGQGRAGTIRMIGAKSAPRRPSPRSSPRLAGCTQRGRGPALCSADLSAPSPRGTVLYRALDRHLETFLARASDQGGGDGLPAFVTRKLRAYLRCGRLEHGCVHVWCEQCGVIWSWRSAARGVASAPRAGAAASGGRDSGPDRQGAIPPSCRGARGTCGRRRQLTSQEIKRCA